MTRPTTRVAATLTALALATAGAACTGADGTPAGTDTEDPVILEPGEEQGETLLPETPEGAGGGTEG